MTCPTIDHATAAAVHGLFAVSPAPLAREVPHSGSDRETARRLLGLALALDGRRDAQAAARDIVPAGALKMELKRLDQPTRAAVACALWAAASGELCWPLPRISSAFGCPLDDVHRLLAAVSAATCRGVGQDVKRGLANLRIAAKSAAAV